jgi:hypothetical protein
MKGEDSIFHVSNKDYPCLMQIQKEIWRRLKKKTDRYGGINLVKSTKSVIHVNISSYDQDLHHAFVALTTTTGYVLGSVAADSHYQHKSATRTTAPSDHPSSARAG